MPTVFPPGDTTSLDHFDRADGNVWAGDGATLWSTVARDGTGSLLRVSGGKLVATGEGGGLTLESVADGIRIFTVSNIASGYLMFFFRMVAGDGYALSMAGGTWTLYAVTGGTVFTEVDSHPTTGNLSSGLRVGVRFEGDEVSVHTGSTRYLNPTPVWESDGLANTGAGACGFQMGSSLWSVDDYADGSLVAPTVGVTIYVNPDHVDASDSRTRSEASDPDTPMLTVQEACWLARAGADWHDTVLVSVCETADLGLSSDPHLQPSLDYRSVDRGTDAVGWPFGNNAGNEPIVIRGDVAIDLDTGTRDDVKAATLPKIHRFGLRGLSNWTVERIQFGYDVDSGDDQNTGGLYERVTDITWRLCHFTGGMGTVQFWADSFHVDRCVIHSPLGSAGGLHPGAGLRLEQSPGEGVGLSIGQLLIEGSEFSNIQGDDALMIGGLYLVDGSEAVDEASTNTIRGTLFHNVAEGDPVFHTDSIQPLQVRHLEVDQCQFIGCSNAWQITDYRNGRVRMTRCLTAGIDVPLQIQGCDEIELIQNTFMPGPTAPALTLLFYDRASLPQRPLATIVNNIFGGFWMRDGTSVNAYFRTGSDISANQILDTPGLVTTHGTNLPGIPEFGYSTRLDAIPNDTVTVGDLERAWELANSPFDSPGVGDGSVTDVPLDMFDRAYASPPDVGALQSDPGTPVTPVARSPYIVARTPAANATGVSGAVSPTATLYPVPGQAIDPLTVTTSTAYVTDPDNEVVPAVVTLSDPVDGEQTVTIDLKQRVTPDVVDGDLFPAVVYTVRLTSGIEDAQGSALTDTSWGFRVAGPVGAAIGDPGAAAGALSIDAGNEAGATIRRIARAIQSVAMPLPDANATGGAVMLGITVDPATGQGTVSLSGGGLNTTQTVLI